MLERRHSDEWAALSGRDIQPRIKQGGYSVSHTTQVNRHRSKTRADKRLRQIARAFPRDPHPAFGDYYSFKLPPPPPLPPHNFYLFLRNKTPHEHGCENVRPSSKENRTQARQITTGLTQMQNRQDRDRELWHLERSTLSCPCGLLH